MYARRRVADAVADADVSLPTDCTHVCDPKPSLRPIGGQQREITDGGRPPVFVPVVTHSVTHPNLGGANGIYTPPLAELRVPVVVCLGRTPRNARATSGVSVGAWPRSSYACTY
jgi:hypothetical protein